MKRNLLILTATICCFCGLLQAQQTYSGFIYEGNTDEPVIGASIFNLTSKEGTITDYDGSFSILAKPSDSLQISYVGFQETIMVLGSQTDLTIGLQEDNNVLDEVIVIGYGTQKVKDLTSSIVTLGSEDIQKTPNSQAMQALQGRAAGVQIVSSGAPGSAPTVRIRGVGSYSGGISNPLYVVDGMFFDNIDFLNPSDIKTLSVLKDASALAIYGNQAANGVVVVETYEGKRNQKASITYDGYYGFQQAQNVLKLANTEQYTRFALETMSARDSSFINAAFQRYGRSRVNPELPAPNTDWYNEILRTAPIQNHNLSINGGGEDLTYSVSGSFFRQEGILDMKNEFERFNVRSRIDFQANDWLKIGANAMLSNSTKFDPEPSVWRLAYYAVPVMPVFDPTNNNPMTTTPLSSARDLGYRGNQNPFHLTEYSNNRVLNKNAFFNVSAQADIIKDKLVFKTSLNYNEIGINVRNVRLPYFVNDEYTRTQEESSINSRVESFNRQIVDNTLTYTENFGKHGLTLLGGHSYREFRARTTQAKGFDLIDLNEENWYIANTRLRPANEFNSTGSRSLSISYFTRLAYNYDNRYLLYGTMRADGSNKYQERWGYFPTVGAGWVLSEESFFNVNAIDYFKIRGSWGQLGNNRVGTSAGSNTSEVVSTAIGDVLTPGTRVSNTFEFLKWEVVEEINVGFGAELFKNRLKVDFDYYVRDTKDAVIDISIPAVGGTARNNAGIIRNSGLELSASYNGRINDDITFTIGGNASTLNNEVLDLFGQSYLDNGTAEFRQRTIVGESLFAFFGRETDGVYQTQAEIEASGLNLPADTEPGDLRYVDQNGDGEIDADDRVVLGSYLPSFSYGGFVNVSAYNFDLSVNLFGQGGNQILNRKRGEVRFTNDTNIDADLAENRWHGPGTSNTYPSAKGVRKGWNQELSNYWIEDGDFFRIQNVQVGYTLRGSALNKYFPEIRVYATAERPFTSFNYNGFTPEVANGVDNETYAIPAIYSFGLRLKIQ